MKTELIWRERVQFTAHAGTGRQFRIDGPTSLGGQDFGLQPMEYMLLSIGGCSSIAVMHTLNKLRCVPSACSTVITAEQALEVPMVFTRIHTLFKFSGPNLSEHKIRRAVSLSVTKYCPASIMLQRAGVEMTHDWTIERSPALVLDSEEGRRNVKTLGMHHVALLSNHYEKARDFYVQTMGMNVEWEPDNDNVYLTSGNDNLALHRAPSVGTRIDSRLDHIGFIVSTENQVDAWFDFLVESNVPIHARPKSHRDGSRSFYALDPDGTTVQVIYHPPVVAKLGN